jgi:hypothetical protein
MEQKQTSGDGESSLTRNSHPAIARMLFMERSQILADNFSASVFPSSTETERRKDPCSTSIVELATSYASYRQQCRTNDAAYHIRSQIIPSRITAGQVHLMPLIKRADQQGAGSRDYQLGPPMQPATHTHSPSQQGKDSSVNQFIPWRGHQIYSNRLCPKHQQAEDNTQRQQQSCDAAVTARYRLSQNQNEH